MKSIRVFCPEDLHECAYLPGQDARSMYVDPGLALTTRDLTLLSYNGFRRSGQLVYKPNCPDCNACTSVRIRLADLHCSRSQKRVLKRNRDLSLCVESSSQGEQHYPVYQKYIQQRHSDGDMFPPTIEQYRNFLLEDYGSTFFLSAYDKDALVSSLVFDTLDDGLSAVYCFFDPDYQQRSPAVFMILTLSQLASGLGKPFHYLGYHISNCNKMSYKTQFAPLEAFISGRWQPYEA